MISPSLRHVLRTRHFERAKTMARHELRKCRVVLSSRTQLEFAFFATLHRLPVDEANLSPGGEGAPCRKRRRRSKLLAWQPRCAPAEGRSGELHVGWYPTLTSCAQSRPSDGLTPRQDRHASGAWWGPARLRILLMPASGVGKVCPKPKMEPLTSMGPVSAAQSLDLGESGAGCADDRGHHRADVTTDSGQTLPLPCQLFVLSVPSAG